MNASSVRKKRFCKQCKEAYIMTAAEIANHASHNVADRLRLSVVQLITQQDVKLFDAQRYLDGTVQKRVVKTMRNYVRRYGGT